ncbi:MAG: hypothetical protein AAGK00_19465 [Pseudomonadota bacterium]
MSTRSTISTKDAMANPDSKTKGRMTVPKFMARKGQMVSEHKSFAPREHPHKGPILDAWAGHYAHAFIALHPFYKQIAHQQEVEAVSWQQVAASLSPAPFADFALAVTLAANGMDGKRRKDADLRLIRDLMDYVQTHGLQYPVDGYVSAALFPDVLRILSALGTETCIARNQHKGREQEITVSDLDKRAFHLEQTGALVHPTDTFIITSFPMDTYHSVVGLTADAFDLLEGNLGLEGFWAGSNTSDGWVNEKGTYSYPQWLKSPC